MGFIDYAWAVSLQKDNTKVKILQDNALTQPVLLSDNFGFTIKLPTVSVLEDGGVSFLGHKFPGNNAGKTKIGRLFRASVIHLTTHTLAPFSKEKIVFHEKDNDSKNEVKKKCRVAAIWTNYSALVSTLQMLFSKLAQ